MATIISNSRITLNPDVVFTDLGTEGVIMNSVTGEAFRLNSTGVLLWRACPADAATLAQILVQAWKISAEHAGADVAAWAQSLAGHALITIRNSDEPPANDAA
ncbi:hypothetical protein PIGHUM_02193 [Pigmentiphaga humi]|uniref:PqqD family protein n=1 Tax=Pigmentiphaga humi TaxID=2478468 RepID=A0A3P4B3M7_9BURK|nr:PqqD family protein [Pigmentiphaga humi]VCU70126.1 hypothetical protein PIGHUM_02193 [Pigmentiphaga humi]